MLNLLFIPVVLFTINLKIALVLWKSKIQKVAQDVILPNVFYAIFDEHLLEKQFCCIGIPFSEQIWISIRMFLNILQPGC